jgi:hypothetical protein
MPSTAVDGQIWLDTDASVPSTTVTRWYKLPTAGTTTLSGNDDNSIPLAYTPGYEQVFLNGTLLSRSAADYTATTGTSVVLSSAIVAGDIVEIICPLQITTTDTYTQAATNAAFQANTNNFAAGKNKIINGDFSINQRSFTSTTTSGSYSFDRWVQFNGGTTGTLTITPQTFTLGAAPVTGYEGKNFVQCVTASGASADTYALFVQKIESVRTLAGQTATISFWAKAASGTPKIGVELSQSFGSGGSPSAEFQTPVGAVTISNSWARYSFTVAVPSISGKTIGTNNDDSFLVSLWLSAGSNFASRTSSIGLQNATFHIWGVQIEAGSNATAFQTATGTIQGELAACQRYFEILNTTNQNDWIGDYYNTTTCYAPIFWKVTKRVAPTLTLPAASSFIVWNAGTALTPSSVGTDTLTTNGGSIYGVTSSRTAGSAGRLRLSSNTISVSAEL